MQNERSKGGEQEGSPTQLGEQWYQFPATGPQIRAPSGPLRQYSPHPCGSLPTGTLVPSSGLGGLSSVAPVACLYLTILATQMPQRAQENGGLVCSQLSTKASLLRLCLRPKYPKLAGHGTACLFIICDMPS